MTEFIYRYNCHSSPDRAHVFLSFKLETTARAMEVAALLKALAAEDMVGFDISDNEMAKSHARYMIGGSQVVPNERMLRFGSLFPLQRGSQRADPCAMRQSFLSGQVRSASSS